MKRTFKDFLQQDNRNVFVNEAEFAETVMINRQPMKIVRDSDMLNQFSADQKLASCEIIFHVESFYFDHLPHPEGWMLFEGEEYRIEKVINDLGMLTIGLGRVTER